MREPEMETKEGATMNEMEENGKPPARTIGVVGIGSEEVVMGQVPGQISANAHYSGPAFGDVRDVLVAAPKQAYADVSSSYICSDIFPEKFKTMQEVAPLAKSVLEIGCFYGHFLLTALEACPEIGRVFWADTELDAPGSNQSVKENIEWWTRNNRSDESSVKMAWGERAYAVCLYAIHQYLQVDIVHVDGYHSERAAVADISMGLMLKPMLLMVDDATAHTPVKQACAFTQWNTGMEYEIVETVNGYAIFRP